MDDLPRRLVWKEKRAEIITSARDYFSCNINCKITIHPFTKPDRNRAGYTANRIRPTISHSYLCPNRCVFGITGHDIQVIKQSKTANFIISQSDGETEALSRCRTCWGTWRGQGEGSFPDHLPFKYSEELQFSHAPNKPVIAYSSKTWKLSSGEPMHSESGFWRPKLDGTIEVVVAQSTGLVEVQKGTYDAEQRSVKLKSSLVGNATKVKR
ncbi:UPF0678 fatty acid-binding protein-like protein [Sesamum alatum]|uniref:UPF0678 fatty acid-binding protein-like protein n=1 Tax=Sesamum alatum TaxID=300844 RepID=A0AAE2CUB1_9LAMI|nr:UPF0678 fatty acid-binding protein-like protein [Sesamum alatum]